MPDFADAIEKSAATLIAAGIVEQMAGPLREQVIRKSLEASLQTYSMKHAVQSAIEERANELARELVQTPEWTAKIVAAVQEGAYLYLNQVPVATAMAMREAMHGKDPKGNYSNRSPAIALQYILFPGEKE